MFYLTSLDFFLWGHLKTKVYESHQPRSLEDLRERIFLECHQTTSEVFRNERNAFESRL